jgi:SAM-dependent methyltransferase
VTVTEGVPFYAPGGLNVEINRLRTEVSAAKLVAGEVEFILDCARLSNGPVLELGCGDGRILFEVARAGIAATGVDLSEGMLEAARQKLAGEPRAVRERVRLVRADIQDFDLGTKFDFAYAAFRTFNFVTTAEGQRACLERLRAHLNPGAKVLIDVFDPPLDTVVPGAGDERLPWLVEVHAHPDTGREVVVQVLSQKFDPLRQVLRQVWRFSEHDAAGAALRSEDETLTMRWVYRWEMRYLFELCGFEVEAEYSDYFGSLPAYAREQIWLARAV